MEELLSKFTEAQVKKKPKKQSNEMDTVIMMNIEAFKKTIIEILKPSTHNENDESLENNAAILFQKVCQV